MKRIVPLILCSALTACAQGSALSARVISTIDTIGPGQQRVLVELSDARGDLVELDLIPNATLRNEDGSPLGVYPGELVWVVPETQPAYAFVMEIPEGGTYQLTVDGGDLGESPPAGFTTVSDSVQVAVGEAAPPLDSGKVAGPGLVVFASPGRCPSHSCQPMIDQVESVADETGLHLSVVDVFVDSDVSDSERTVAPVVVDWGLPSQPWLYVIDGSGTVVALFEGAVSDRELADAVALISE